MNYYRRFPGDYSRDTSGLNLIEHGAYALLLDELYSTERPIPSLECAFRACKVQKKSEKRAIKVILSRYFIKTSIGWTQKRFEEELSYADSRRTKSKTAWESRWRKNAPSNPPSNARDYATPDNQTTILPPPYPPTGGRRTTKAYIEAHIGEGPQVVPISTERRKVLNEIRTEWENLRQEGRLPPQFRELDDFKKFRMKQVGIA